VTISDSHCLCSTCPNNHSLPFLVQISTIILSSARFHPPSFISFTFSSVLSKFTSCSPLLATSHCHMLHKSHMKPDSACHLHHSLPCAICIYFIFQLLIIRYFCNCIHKTFPFPILAITVKLCLLPASNVSITVANKTYLRFPAIPHY